MENLFNPYKSRQAQDVTFNRKTKNIIHSNFYFNNLLIVTAASQKHLGLKLDTKLTFNDFINVSIFYFNFDIFNKSLMKPHLVYGDVIYVKMQLSLITLNQFNITLHWQSQESLEVDL